MLPVEPYYTDNDPEFQRLMRRLHSARTKTVIHHETCPCCGAKLVNLYRKNVKSAMWKCRKCWEKYEQDSKEASENGKYRCSTCQVYANAIASKEPTVCKWYMDNIVCGNESIKSCPNYEPVKGE